MKYYEIEPEENHFRTLLADVTHKCQMECSNCYIPNRSIEDMDAGKFERFVSKLPRRTDIRLIGAEATLRSDLPQLISMIRRHGHRPTLLTNGLRLSSKSYCEKLYKSGLKSYGLSMNGGTSDHAYKVLDGGEFASQKIKALKNSIEVGFVVHLNCILVPEVNEEAPIQLLGLYQQFCEDVGRTAGAKYPLMLRFKNVGQVGRFMDGRWQYDMNTMLDLISDSFRISKDQITKNNLIDGHHECKSFLFSVPTKVGAILVKVTDWQVDDEGVPDAGSRRRGRVTQEFKIAPFFEHVKRNENGY